jgi:beta-galactosidase GanA
MKTRKHKQSQRLLLLAFLTLGTLPALRAQSQTHPIPEIVQKNGRYALFVDGAPYLMLGAQVNNSSAWPATLPKVWPAIDFVQANTVEIPVYWEQFEPEQGHFDYTLVDTLLAQAREHSVHLVLLWFGTWKNGSSHYMPLWLKRTPDLSPRIIGANGRVVDSPSPYATTAMQDDMAAFAALMRHLKAADAQRTVIMVQVENEPGSWGSARDFSPTAQKLFEAPVPAELLSALHLQVNSPSANWQQVFGDDADVFFNAWSVAHYIGQVAAAGKAVYPLPLYVNAALKSPTAPGSPCHYECGGATDNVIAIWKAAAPAIDIEAPDIYMNDSTPYLAVLDLYHRPDNPLFVPETGNSLTASRFFFAALGRQTIGYSPFGIDYTGYADTPLGASRQTEDSLAPLALNYKLIGPMDREIAQLNFEGKLQAVVEEKGRPSQSFDDGSWTVTVSYGPPVSGRSGPSAGNPDPIGRALVAQLGDDQFLVTGYFCRVDFRPSDPASQKQRQFLRVEEGNYENGVFKPIRIWNGDQTDWGLNFSSAPQVLRVTLGTY